MKRFKRDELISLMIPIFLESLFVNLLGFFDTFMISKYSQDSVVAIGNSTTVMGIFIVLLNVAARGTNVIISQFLGAKQEDNAHKTLHSGIIFNLVFSLILFLIVQIFGLNLLELIRVDKRYILEASKYLKIVSFGIPFLALTNVFAATFRSYKKPKILTISALISNICNVILNFILIFGIAGFLPALGSVGAAIATLFSYLLNFLIGLIFLKRLLKIKIFSFHLDKRTLKMLLNIGLPSALESFVYTFCNMILMSAINILDTSLPGLAAGRSYLNQMLGFVFQLSGAFGIANSILVGHAVGEGNNMKAKRTTLRACLICVPVVEVLVLILVLAGKYIFTIYSPNNESDMKLFEVALSQILKVLPFMFFLELGRGLNLIMVNALQAAGDVIYPLISAIVSMLLFMAGGSYLFGVYLKMGLLGVYLGCIIDECLRALLMLIRWWSGRWEKKSLIKAI